MRQNTQENLRHRLHRIEGQVRGLQKMVEEGEYCIDVINQSSAIRNALSSLEDVMLENHLSEHVAEQMKRRQRKKAVSEIISVFKKAKHK